jgi:hypothetical protein
MVWRHWWPTDCIAYFSSKLSRHYNESLLSLLKMLYLHKGHKLPINYVLETSMHYTPQDAHHDPFLIPFLIRNGDPDLSLIYRLRVNNRAQTYFQ